MDLKELTKHLFKCHQNPLKKVELPSSKYFLKSPDNVQEILQKYRKNLQESLEYTRVERRCARSKGIWLDDLNLCRVTKVVGILLKNFGFQDKTGIFLTPEETLYLLEQNRLELTYNNEQVTICSAYSIITNICPLKKYRVFKKLVGQGFKLCNKRTINKFYLNEKASQKRKMEFNPECSSEKIVKLEQNSVNFEKIFEKLKQDGPQLIQAEKMSKSPDYFGFLPASTNKHRHDFNLYIRDEINVEDFGNHEDVLNIFAICTNDNVAFYRFPCVNIPSLI